MRPEAQKRIIDVSWVRYRGKCETIESLKAWVESRALSLSVLKVTTKTHWSPHATVRFRQLQRAALSIQLSIAEGHALGDRGRFGNHLSMAYGSATETCELIELAADDAIVPREIAGELVERCHLCERLLLGLLKRYRARPVR